MLLTINPITNRLKEVVKSHGAHGWTVLRNDPECSQRGGQSASLVVKSNKMLWLTMQEMITNEN